jgi:hypothetical protein
MTNVMMSMESCQIRSHASTDTIPEVVRVHRLNVTCAIRTDRSGLEMMPCSQSLMPGTVVGNAGHTLTAIMPAGKRIALPNVMVPGITKSGIHTLMA